MKNLKKKIIAGVLGTALMLAAIAGISAANVSSGDDNAVARKVNEYEGQHVAAGGSKNGEVPVVTGQLLSGDPSQWGFASNVAGDPSQWGVTRNVVGDPSQWGITTFAGGSKNGDVPVVGGLV